MRILFFGTSKFAVPSLQSLLDAPEHNVLAVVTQPDRPSGRGSKVLFSPIKELAAAHDLTILQPEKVRTREFRLAVQSFQPDVLVVAAFGQIISQRMLDIPPFGGVNVHGSLLPRWRGAAPMQYALMAGDAETGVTTMQMDAGMDTGDILLQSVLPLADDDTLESVENKLSHLGAPLLLETLERLKNGDCPRLPQNPALVTLSPPLPPDFGFLDFARPARELHNLVRGVTPKPGAYTFWDGKRVKIWRTTYDAAGRGEPGRVEKKETQGITIGTGAGVLCLTEVQPESKGRMTADAWARGARLQIDQTFSGPT